MRALVQILARGVERKFAAATDADDDGCYWFFDGVSGMRFTTAHRCDDEFSRTIGQALKKPDPWELAGEPFTISLAPFPGYDWADPWLQAAREKVLTRRARNEPSIIG